MIAFGRWMKWMTVFLILGFLFFIGPGCTTYKDAVAAPVKTTPVPAATSPPPAADVKK